MRPYLQTYIGTKQVRAAPMTLGDYNVYRGWDIPDDEDPGRDGYLVVYPDGYESWSPADQFQGYYLPMGNDGSRVSDLMVDDFITGHEITRLGNHTVCLVYLRNGFTLVVDSACVDPANYDVIIGEDLCLKKAKAKVWELLGFLLATGRNGVN